MNFERRLVAVVLARFGIGTAARRILANRARPLARWQRRLDTPRRCGGRRRFPRRVGAWALGRERILDPAPDATLGQPVINDDTADECGASGEEAQLQRGHPL